MEYAAFYIPKEEPEKKVANSKLTQKTENLLSQSINAAKNKISNFDVKSVAKNITLQSANEFVQKYAVGALTNIINGQPITNQTMMDSLFNGLAPALELTAFQTGFNSVMQMKNALCSGNVNIPQFLTGLENGLQLIQDTNNRIDYSKYGDEIVIDLTVEFAQNNITESADRRVESGQIFNEYVHNLPKMLAFRGIVKNNKTYTCDEFCELIDDVKLAQRPFNFRAGNKIYENYVFSRFDPVTQNINALEFEAEIKKFTTGTIELVKVNIPKQNSANKNSNGSNKRKQVANKIKGQVIKNATQQTKYEGMVGAVEWLLNSEGSSTQVLDGLIGNLRKIR